MRFHHTNQSLAKENGVDSSGKEDGIIYVLIKRFETQRLPRALALKVKVDGGGRLNDLDMAFLEEVLSDARHIKPMVDEHPEWQSVYTKAADLYDHTLTKARENESG
jgi:hypothetical protein